MEKNLNGVCLYERILKCSLSLYRGKLAVKRQHTEDPIPRESVLPWSTSENFLRKKMVQNDPLK